MRKSSIYLPDELKRRLSELAARSGRSEADLIRHAIERLVAVTPQAEGTRAAGCPHRPPAFVGVGVGPGDPQLVTERARATLAAADRVIAISTDVRSIGRAEMVVRAVSPSARVQRIGYDISGDEQHRQGSLAEVLEAVLAAVDAGELVALAVLGDPSQWTVFPDLAASVRRARPGVPVTAEPGVTSYQAAAAVAGVPLGARGGSLTVLADTDTLADVLAEPADGIVVYKAAAHTAALRADAARCHRPGLVAELSGMPGQRLVPLDESADGPLPYLSTVVFPAVTSTATTPTGAGVEG